MYLPALAQLMVLLVTHQLAILLSMPFFRLLKVSEPV